MRLVLAVSGLRSSTPGDDQRVKVAIAIEYNRGNCEQAQTFSPSVH
jgi:hypothetical protein